MEDARRAIPSIDRLLASEPFATLLAREPRALVAAALESVQDEVRTALSRGDAPPPGIGDAQWYAEASAERLNALRRPSLRPVINATGVILHTNLGRAPLAVAAQRAIGRAAVGYSNLEYDIEEGERGSRYTHCTDLLRRLTGAEAALVVNNNAAALVLALNTLAAGRDAVISRGELIEIGGSFRIPDIMARSGARMREVGATNRTHLDDYAAAIDEACGVILKVHPSNFRIEGFASEVASRPLADLARERGIPLLHDLGSGLLLDSATLGLPYEPTPMDALRAGATVVTMSGDKLLGGPQAGILLGSSGAIDAMRRNPLCRALRVDKLTLAGLEATLMLYLDPATARAEIPVLRMLTMKPDELDARARGIVEQLRTAGVRATVRAGDSAVGGGAFPAAHLPTRLVRLESGTPAHVIERRLRAANPPVIVRVMDDHACIDPRTVDPAEEPALIEAIARAGH
ncbi:MAG: L-seryl-tRNA(Sec) selenium transferase [Gemmatimonadetes bacterium]|nr:L-seryl-tRNA(Sec) selenium transferase [Gemmatimonadota bacterium]